MLHTYGRHRRRLTAVAMRRALMLLASLLYLLDAAAQGVVRGTVRDVAGQPIPAATVAYGPSRGTYTDHLGAYSLNLPAGRSTLTVSSVGYKTVRATIDPAQTHTHDFVLEEDAVKLNVVEVYAKSRSQQHRPTRGFGTTSLPIRSTASVPFLRENTRVWRGLAASPVNGISTGMRTRGRLSRAAPSSYSGAAGSRAPAHPRGQPHPSLRENGTYSSRERYLLLARTVLVRRENGGGGALVAWPRTPLPWPGR